MGVTEREKMTSGQPYRADDPELCRLRLRGQRLIRAYNELDDDSQRARRAILDDLFAEVGDGTLIQSGFRCEYGFTITIGREVFMNYNCTLLDVCPIAIGDRAKLGPGVQLITATHPLDAAERRRGWESGEPITIDEDAWLGAGVHVCPGVRIGRGTTVGAGAVVATDLPAGVLAVGVPARVIRSI